MELPKHEVVSALRGAGNSEKADEADRQLSDPVDTDADRAALEALGADVTEIVDRIVAGGTSGV